MALRDVEGKPIRKGDWVVARAGRAWSRKVHQVRGFWDFGEGSPESRVEIACGSREYRPGSLLVVSEPPPAGSGEDRYECPRCREVA